MPTATEMPKRAVMRSAKAITARQTQRMGTQRMRRIRAFQLVDGAEHAGRQRADGQLDLRDDHSIPVELHGFQVERHRADRDER